jgi:phospho-acceptor domain-containing protein
VNRDIANLAQNACRFVDRLSHEFRTPLTVVKEYTTILREGLAGQVSEKQQEMLDVIHDRANDLTMMLEAMMDLGRIESGIFRLWRKTVPVESIIESTARNVKEKAAVKKLSLDIQLDDPKTTLWCDEDKLVKALSGLLAYLMRFSNESAIVSVRAKTVKSDDTGEQLRLKFSCPSTCFEEPIIESVGQFLDGPHTDERSCAIWEIKIAAQLIDLHFGQISLETNTDDSSPDSADPNSSVAFEVCLPTGRKQDDIVRLWGETFSGSGGQAPTVELLEASIGEDQPEPVAGMVDEFLQRTVACSDLVVLVSKNCWRILLLKSDNSDESSTDRINALWRENQADHSGFFPELSCRQINMVEMPDKSNIGSLLKID